MIPSILQPLLAMVFLSFLVWVLLFITRIGYMKRHHITPEMVKTPDDANRLLPESTQQFSNNFKNLFEVPVLFYLLCVLTIVLQISNEWLTAVAWLYVGLRVIHSLIHVTYNQVMHRFVVYFVSCWVLWAGFVILAVNVYHKA